VILDSEEQKKFLMDMVEIASQHAPIGCKHWALAAQWVEALEKAQVLPEEKPKYTVED
jgi:hypothetical protein